MKKNLLLSLFGFLCVFSLSSCSKTQINKQNDDKQQLSEQTVNSSNSLELVQAEKAKRLIPDEWKLKLSESNSRYSIGKINNEQGVWFCLVYFSESSSYNNIESCQQVTNVELKKTASEVEVIEEGN